MAAPPHTRAFQAYNSHNYRNRPTIKKSPISSVGEPSVFGRTPYVSIKATAEPMPLSASPLDSNNIIKPIPMTPHRRASNTSLGQLLPRRKSSQMTALATKRQNLWMSIAKNAQANNNQSSTPSSSASSLPLPIQQQIKQPNLMRKKLLRLLLVFSYLLSISLFAIALATFYGFFWSDYSTSQTVSTPLPLSMSNMETAMLAAVPSRPNATAPRADVSLDNVSEKKEKGESSTRSNSSSSSLFSPRLQQSKADVIKIKLHLMHSSRSIHHPSQS